jgi:Macrocin-O-methyltransferase (TylF)
MLESSLNAPIIHLEYFAQQAQNLNGLVLEFGVATGGTIKKIASTLPDRTVYGFDWFQGLPEDWTNGYMAGHFACDKPTDLPENVVIVEGLFKKTVPGFIKEHKDEKVAFMHVDCDIYSSAKYVLDKFEKKFQDGSIVVFDEFIKYNNYQHHEWKAWHEFLEKTKYKYEVLGRAHEESVAFRIYK